MLVTGENACFSRMFNSLIGANVECVTQNKECFLKVKALLISIAAKYKTMRITVLGCGMVGSAIVKDLSKHHQVLVTDQNIDSLKCLNLKQIETIAGDIRD